MATEEEGRENDTRWSSFKDTTKTSSLGVMQKEPEKDFTQYLGKVLKRQSPRKRQERKYKVAAHLVRLVTGVAYAVDAKWKSYINADNKKGVKTAPLRTLSEDKYEAMVPLIRPMRLDGFRVVQKGLDELPQHRCLIQVNPSLCKEEATLVQNEWEPYVDKKGFLNPKGILSWFNTGLSKACSIVLSENHNVDKLLCHVGEDGTAKLHVMMSESNGEELEIDEFVVNIFPVFIIDKLPSSLKLNAPLPCFGPYIQGQKTFRELVMADIENGKEIMFLDPKVELSTNTVKNCLPRDDASWKLNLSFTEYHVYSIIDKYCRGVNFRHVLVLMNILREENPSELGVLNNEIIVNVLFVVSQKHIHKIFKTNEWLFKLLQTLRDGLNCGYLPSFYLPRQNLLTIYGTDTASQTAASGALQTIMTSLKDDPKNIYKFTGYVEKKKGKNDEEVEEEDDDIEDDSNKEETLDNIQEDEREETLSVYDEVNENNVPVSDTKEEESAVTKLSKRGDRSDIY